MWCMRKRLPPVVIPDKPSTPPIDAATRIEMESELAGLDLRFFSDTGYLEARDKGIDGKVCVACVLVVNARLYSQ